MAHQHEDLIGHVYYDETSYYFHFKPVVTLLTRFLFSYYTLIYLLRGLAEEACDGDFVACQLIDGCYGDLRIYQEASSKLLQLGHPMESKTMLNCHINITMCNDKNCNTFQIYKY